MKKLYIILIIFSSYFNHIYSQNNYEFEISEGFVFFDYFGNEPKGFDKVFAGYGLQSEFDIWRSIYKKNPLTLKVGIGYTNYYYLYDYGFTFIARNELSTSYLNLKLGVDYNPKWSKVSFLMNSTNYFLYYKEKQQHSQNRWFNNLDLGLKFKLFKHVHISFWTPLTLFPMHNGALVQRPINLSINFKPFIEITGLNLGISYGFGEK